ncbi:UvrABC system protein C [Variibacter gotjawalensis]|uniref:UvrABC system protein C n=1 Tax=Variibacter gotjawalensis TaxID=1333996 RepID=A0A0S3PTH6_9BRAD|nr:excinuclease ABC subunit UvrC [Variibacter gotjawalensis]NIK49557.1 excinuclease ABC subunit C [Variibacter gotjawalensis]RZS45568.1 excinuclease ABC subunit C [Variibacter gotjawalensis]BAT59241.1 UvrABC system protein C [Variibacter gotjawalensis]
MNRPKDIEPGIEPDEKDEEASLPEEQTEAFDLVSPEGVAAGHAALARYVKLAPSAPGVYRMIDAAGEVLYVGKAKNIRKRVTNYLRPGHDGRISRMIASIASVEFVSTHTETEALLLEANLIKRLRPRFNVLMRDDKSFPYILITKEERPAQIVKHRGARSTPGAYFGPFASAGSVGRTITTLQRAFLLRSCSDAVFDSRTRPCLLHQIKRCSAPCTDEISRDDYGALVGEATAFLSGRSQAVKEHLATDMQAAAEAMDYERAAIYRDRLAALSAVQAQQGINPRATNEADVFAIHQQGGFTCIEVFFFRTGQNWGNRAYFPRADRALEPGAVLSAFIAQFYDDKPCPRLVLVSHALEDQALLAEALSVKSEVKVEVSVPQRGEKKELVDHALANGREALARKLAESSSQLRLLQAMAQAFALPDIPKRIEVYDNSHIQGTNALGAMIVAGREGFRKDQYRKFNIRSTTLTPGDDYGMMREVLTRRFKRLIDEAPRAAPAVPVEDIAGDVAPVIHPQAVEDDDAAPDSPWPDLVMIDGGLGQLTAARETFAELGIVDVPLIAIAKGVDRDAGRESFFQPGRQAFRLPPRDPVLYFVQRLRDEAHRFAIGSHRQKRAKGLREGGLQEIPGIGPTRKRALLHHFGTLKAIERASAADLANVPGINAETARKIYDFFHDGGANRPAGTG